MGQWRVVTQKSSKVRAVTDTNGTQLVSALSKAYLDQGSGRMEPFCSAECKWILPYFIHWPR
jgi:hypothetical protein